MEVRVHGFTSEEDPEQSVVTIQHSSRSSMDFQLINRDAISSSKTGENVDKLALLEGKGYKSRSLGSIQSSRSGAAAESKKVEVEVDVDVDTMMEQDLNKRYAQFLSQNVKSLDHVKLLLSVLQSTFKDSSSISSTPTATNKPPVHRLATACISDLSVSSRESSLSSAASPSAAASTRPISVSSPSSVSSLSVTPPTDTAATVAQCADTLINTLISSTADRLRVVHMLSKSAKKDSAANSEKLVSSPVNKTLRARSPEPKPLPPPPTLTLEEVLDTPQYMYHLEEFMVQSLCAENLRFLSNVKGYKEMPKLTERKEIADMIISKFVQSEIINVGEDEKQDILAKYNKKDWSVNMFDEAYKCVFEMVEKDVFRRFLCSPAADAILAEKVKENTFDSAGLPKATSLLNNPTINSLSRKFTKTSITAEESTGRFADLNAKDKGRGWMAKKNSFSFSATTEDNRFLVLLCKQLPHSIKMKDKMKGMTRHKDCFKAAHLIDWLVESGHCRSRTAAKALGQRLVDAHMMRCLDDATLPFEDSKQLFSLHVYAKKNGPSVSYLQGKKIRIASGFLLQKGVKYNKVFVVVRSNKKKLYIFTSDTSDKPVQVLRNAWCAKPAEITVAVDRKISYLNFNNIVVFRLTSEEQRLQWVEQLYEQGIVVNQVTVETDENGMGTHTGGHRLSFSSFSPTPAGDKSRGNSVDSVDSASNFNPF